MAILLKDNTTNSLLFIGQPFTGDLGWYAYLLPKDCSYNLNSLDVGKSFNNLTGSYLFSSKAIDVSTKAKADSLVDTLQSYIANNFGTDRCLIWSERFDPAEPIYSLSFNNSGKRTRAAQWRISSGLTLYWDSGGIISYNNDESISFSGSIGLKSSVGRKSDYPLKNVKISFKGPGSGCVEGDLCLSLNGDFDDLDIGLRYFAPNTQSDDYYTQRYPLLPSGDSIIRFRFRIDPTDPLSEIDPQSFRRSGMAFATLTNAPPQALTSSFVTTAGRKITLTPVIGDNEANPARLVFARKKESGDDYYLTPHGDFTLGVESPDPDNGSFNLLCGLGATECIIFSPKGSFQFGNRLRFKAGMPALSALFPADGAVLDKADSSSGKLFVTSWATLVALVPVSLIAATMWKNPDTPWYDVQPVGAPLFAKDEEVSDFLKFHLGGISLAWVEDLYLPLVPYSSLQVDPENGPFDAKGIADFELKVLGPARKSLIDEKRFVSSNSGQRTLSGQTKNYATPQGFIVTVGDNGIYTDLLLARTGKSSSPVNLKFTNPSMQLQAALQTNQLFLVATNNGKLGSLSDDPASSESRFLSHISIAGWDFKINVPSYVEGEDYRNVMILKFCKGTLQELVKKPELWTQADDFNDSSQKTALSLWLQDYIEDAIEKGQDSASKEGALFAKFKDIAVREDWNGILLLKVDIESLPSNLSGIMAGVDRNEFFAHHLGIEANHIDSETIDIKGQSSAFGAVYYNDSSDLLAVDGDFNFRVKDLGGLFENSALKSFESRVELVMNQILGHPVLRATTAFAKLDCTSIVLKGSCQKKEDSSASSTDDDENMVFVMDSDESSSFYLDSNILRKVELVKAQMSMAESGSDGTSRTSITRFDFWGFMDFSALKYQAKAASPASARREIRPAILMPLSPAFGGGLGANRGARTEEGRNAVPILVDMEVNNEIWELPETFLYTLAKGKARGPAKLSVAARADASQIRLFDILSFGNDYYLDDKNEWAQKDEARKGLYFSGLSLLMSCTEEAGALKTFSFDLSRMAFDPERSTAREGSLVKQFGLKIEGIDIGDKDAKPDGGGYVKVDTRARGPGLSSPGGVWYGLRFRLNMGTLGDLAGKAGLTSSLRAAWGAEASGDSESYSAFVGVKLPGSEGVKLFDLQGFMKLSIGAVRLGCVGNGSFVLTLSSIALKLLGLLKIPPSGATSFYLFGSAEAEEKGLGWYAMYRKE